MAAMSVAIIGKNNEPIYMKEFLEKHSNNDRLDYAFEESQLFGLPVERQATDTENRLQCSLQQQFILHEALDRFDQLAGPHPGYAWRKQGSTGSDGMFVGLIQPMDDMRVYGYMTTTQMKLLLVLKDHAHVEEQKTVDEAIKRLFVKVHRLYVEYLLNPFGPLTGIINSSSFDKKLNEVVQAFNQSQA